MIKEKFGMLAMWVVVCLITFFAMDKDGAPDWAKELELLLGLGIFLVLLNQAIDEIDKL